MNAHRAARRLTIALSGLAVTATAGLGTGTAAAAGSELIYAGQSSITIATYDYCDLTTGQRRPVGKRTYTGLIYWSVDHDGETGALQAELIEDHREEAAAYNLVNVDQQLVPCNPQMGAIPMVAAMAEGTQLAGTLGDSAGSIEFVGTSSDGMYDFHVTTELTRSS